MCDEEFHALNPRILYGNDRGNGCFRVDVMHILPGEFVEILVEGQRVLVQGRVVSSRGVDDLHYDIVVEPVTALMLLEASCR